MAIEMKITIPSNSSVMSDGWSRNSIFRIINAGGIIEAEGLMNAYRNLDQKVKSDFASRILVSNNLNRSQLEELFENHKRSKNIRNIAMVKQHALTNEEANNFMEDFTKQVRRSFQRDFSNGRSLSWGATGRKLGGVMTFFNLSEEIPFLPGWLKEESGRGVEARSIDLFSEDLLYSLSCEIAKAFEKELLSTRSNFATSGTNWWISAYLGAICSGRRSSPLAPLMSSSNKSLADAAVRSFLYIVEKEKS